MITNVSIKPGCIACKNCERTCPNVFKVAGTSQVIGKDFSSNVDAIKEAARNCPVQVITVEDTDTTHSIASALPIQAQLIEKKLLTSDVTEFIFSVPETGTFLPGQFAAVTLIDSNGAFTRYYSIRSWKNGRLTLCIKLLPNGRGSLVLQHMALDTTLSMHAGIGNFVLKNTPYPKLFIATGTGLSPIMAMLDEVSTNLTKVLLFGIQKEKDIFYKNELASYDRLHTEYCVSNPGETFMGTKGRVTDALVRMVFSKDIPTEVYICGNPMMVESVRTILEAKNVSSEHIYFEHFISPAAPKEQSPEKKSPLQLWLPWLQRILLLASILTPLQYFYPSSTSHLWNLSLYAVTLLMLIRPLRDLFPKIKVFSTLIPLRKELGIFSASVITSSALIHYLNPNVAFFSTYFSLDYWSFTGNKFAAHLGELTGIILLLTSNTWSQKLLGKYWKMIQRLSYVYFFSGAWYVWASFGKSFGLWGMILVGSLTLLAFIKNNFFPHHE